MQRRVEEPDGHRQAVHRVDDRRKVGLLHHVEFVQDLALVGRVVAEDQSADQLEPLFGQEHVLGAAQPDAVGAEVTRVRSVVGGVGVGANTDPSGPDQVGPAQQRLELRRRGTGRCDDRALDHVAGPAVDRDLGALGVEGVADADAAVDHHDLTGADHGGNAPAASDDCSVAHQAATGGEDAAGGLHSEHVVGGRLGAYEDDVEPAIGRLDGCLGARHDAPRRRARRRGEAGRQDGVVAVRVEAGVHERRQFGCRDPQDGVGDGGVGERIACLGHGRHDQLGQAVGRGRVLG